MTIIRVNLCVTAFHAVPTDVEALAALVKAQVYAKKGIVSAIPAFPNAMGKNAAMTDAVGSVVHVTAATPAYPENA